ncbi:MAG: hypothetical protein C0608_05560 [Deltaproteobacteria bacterium]|nr:MAG: hypothetical protein C0608_05560 [Deltaproteobacteria bacterium]
MDSNTLLILAFVGGLLRMDRTALVQTMLSRPVLAAPLAGIIIGDIPAGILCGVLMEPIWLARIPVGSRVPPDETIAAITAVAGAKALSSGLPWPGYALVAVVLALPMGLVGRWLDFRVRKANDALYFDAVEVVERGGVPRVGRAQFIGALRFFLAGAVGTMVGVALITGLGSLIGETLSGRIGETTYQMLMAFVTVAGAGALLTGIAEREGRVAFAAGIVGNIIFFWVGA